MINRSSFYGNEQQFYNKSIDVLIDKLMNYMLLKLNLLYKKSL
jgi:hypothetical protein